MARAVEWDARPEEALLLLEQARDVVRRARRPEVLARAWEMTGDIHDDLGNLSAALAAYRRVLALRRRIRDRHGEATALSSLALVHRRRGRLAQARALLEQALALEDEEPEPDVEAIVDNLGSVLRDLGDLETAREYATRALAHAQALGSPESVATSLNNVAMVEAELSNDDRARDLYQQALQVWQRIRHRHGLARTLSNLAVLEIRAGQVADGMRLLVRAERLHRRTGNRSGMAMVWNDIGLALHRTSQPARGLAWYNRAADLHAEVGDVDEELTSVSNQIELAKELGFDVKASSDRARRLSDRLKRGR